MQTYNINILQPFFDSSKINNLYKEMTEYIDAIKPFQVLSPFLINYIDNLINQKLNNLSLTDKINFIDNINWKINNKVKQMKDWKNKTTLLQIQDYLEDIKSELNNESIQSDLNQLLTPEN